MSTPDELIRKARIFVVWGLLPHFALVGFVLLATHWLEWFRLWPEAHDFRLQVFFGFEVAVLLITVAYLLLPREPLVKARYLQWIRRNLLLYAAVLIQILILFLFIRSTGGVQGSPFSIYYFYIPSVVGITFVTKDSKGILAVSVAAVGCLACVALHLFVYTEDWNPFATITVRQLNEISAICQPSASFDTTDASRISAICATAQPLTANDLWWYRVVSLAAFLLPLSIALWIHKQIEHRHSDPVNVPGE